MRDPDFNEQALVKAARERQRHGLQGAERQAEVLAGGLAVAMGIALWLFPVTGDFSPLAAIVCVVGMLAAHLARFEVGGAFTVPLQLAFVPLLFAVPAQAVPIVVVAVLVLARLPAVVRGEAPPARLGVELGNAWFAIGAAAVLIAVGGPDALLDEPLLAVAVVGGQFAADLAASVMREAYLRRLTLRALWDEAGWVYVVDASLTAPPMWMMLSGASVAGSVVALLPLVVVLGSFARERSKRLESLFELNSAYHGTAVLLGNLVEADDTYTGRHSRGVVELAVEVGHELGLDPDRLRNLEFSALLHDVGKVAIPKEIINKPGRLDPREWEIVKTHTVEGQRMLDQVGGFMADVGNIVRSHHERWDGAGYPDGLAGEAIPLEARIVTACDSYSAMTTDRVYRAALPREEALRELREHAGSQFDPVVAAALLRILAADPQHDGDTGGQPGSLGRLRAA